MDVLTKYASRVFIAACVIHLGRCFYTRPGSIGNEQVHYAIFEAKFSWFEARNACLQMGYDDLDDGNLTSIHHHAIIQRLTEDLSQFSLDTFWTFFHLADTPACGWYQSGCGITDRVNVPCTNNRKCIILQYSSEYSSWNHLAEVCTKARPFICVKHLGPVAFEPYTSAKILEFSATVTKNRTTEDSYALCKLHCGFHCVAFNYSVDQCDIYTLMQSKTFAYFNLSIAFSIVELKRGINVTFVPESETIELSVPPTFPCPNDVSTLLPSTMTTSTTPITTQMSSAVTTSTTPIITSVPSTMSTATTPVTTSLPSTMTSTDTTPTKSDTMSTPRESTLTSTSAIPSTSVAQVTLPPIIDVIGFTDAYANIDVHVFMTPVTWFEAQSICESEERFGSLPSYDHDVLVAKVAAILEENGMDPNSALWTSVFRQEEYETVWYTGGRDSVACNVTDDAIEDIGGQCAYISLDYLGMHPILFSENCTEKLPFACARKTELSASFHSHPGYGTQTRPNACSLEYVPGTTVSECIGTCESTVSCFGFTFFDPSNCILLIADPGLSYIEYSLERHGSGYTHYVKTGSTGTFHPANTGFNSTMNVSNTFPQCMASSTTTAPSTAPASTTPVIPLDDSEQGSSDSISTPPPRHSSSSPPVLQNVCLCLVTSKFCAITDDLDHSTLEKVLQSIIANLEINMKSTSAYRRSLTSAEDGRGSSAVIGIVAIVCLSLSLSIIVFPDMVNLAVGVKNMLFSSHKILNISV